MFFDKGSRYKDPVAALLFGSKPKAPDVIGISGDGNTVESAGI